MFTGLVEGVARIGRWEGATDAGARLWLTDWPFAAAELSLGESVAVNGCCLSVNHFGEAGEVGFDLLAETLAVTNLQQLSAGRGVNVERALAVGQRLGGHFVQGHVDGRVRVARFAELESGDWELVVELDPADLGQVLPRGSICLDGISLTAARVDDAAGTVTAFIIPHTRSLTRLAQVQAGDWLNVEFDLLGKFVRRQVAGLG